MRKFTLILTALLLALTVEAKYNFNLGAINPWGGDSGAGVTVSEGTITYTTAWTGATVWPAPDLTGYTHIYVRLASNCAFVFTAQGTATATVSVGASTSEQVIIVPIPGNKASFGGLGFQAKEAGSIAIKEISAINMTAEFTESTYGAPGLGWPSEEAGVSTANTYNEGTKTITMGHYIAEGHETDWCGVQWWVAWDSEKSGNYGADYSAYDKIVVNFSEAVTSSGGIRIDYRKENNPDENEATNTYVGFENSATQVEVPLNSTFKGRVCAIVFQGPQDAVYKLESVKLVKNGNYYPLSNNATTVTAATPNALVELERPLSTGWNSICLPITANVSSIAATAELYEFTSATASTVTLTKKDDGVMVANTPYFVKLSASISIPIIFNDVTLSTATAGEVTNNGLTLHGNYTPNFDMENKYGVVNSENKIMKGGSGSTLNAYSAYFDGTFSGSRSFSITIDDETTSIDNVISKMSEVRGDVFFDLQGRRVANPTKGLYIVNGKKVIIK